MNISRIKSIELNREKPFNHIIQFKDKHGSVIETIKVDDSAGFEKLQLITEAWLSHPDAQPEPPNTEELYQKRKDK